MTTRSHVAARTRRSGSGGSLAIGFSAAGVPAVDWQRNPRDHRGGVAEQEHDRSSDLGFGGPPAGRNRVEEWSLDASRPQYQADMGVITTVGLTEFTRM